MLEIPLNTVRSHDPRCTVFNTCGGILYHYTSVETLGLILKNRTVRFNRLDRVNDPREALSTEYAAAQTLVFATCWTDSADESLPLWKMYTDLTGVRLAMPTLMFNGRQSKHKVTTDDRLYQINVESVSPGAPLFQIDRRGERFHGLAGATVEGPTRVRYFSDEALLRATNVSQMGGRPRIDFRVLGTAKHRCWDFEHEVRYRVFAVFGYATDEFNHDWMTPDSLIRSPVVTEFVDVPLDQTAVEEAGIMLGPKATDSDRMVVESICSRYAPNATIERSSIPVR